MKVQALPRGDARRRSWAAFVRILAFCLLTPPLWQRASADETTPVTFTWDGSCYQSQVGGFGEMTVNKTWVGGIYHVTLDGYFDASSGTFGYLRKALPPGLRPYVEFVTGDPATAFHCTGTYTPTGGSAIDVTTIESRYDGVNGVHVRTDVFEGAGSNYSVHGEFWLLEKTSGRYNLHCEWDTLEADTPSAWAACPGIRFQPDVAVRLQPEGTELADGVSSVDFGTVDVGSSTQRTLAIVNTSTLPMNLSGLAVMVDGPDADRFVAGPPGATTLAPGESTTLTVTFSSAVSGTRGAALHIGNNTATKNPFDVQLTASARPVAAAQNVTVTRNTPKAITLSGSGPAGPVVNFTVVTPPAHGALSGTIPNLTYTPNAGYEGPDSFTFTLDDGVLTSTEATVGITVLVVNSPPVANPQSVTVVEDTPKLITLGGSDPDGGTPNLVVATPPSHGTLSGLSPNLTYTPHADYSGPDSFTFTANDGELTSGEATVTINVTSVNDAPTAIPQSVAGTEGVALPIVLAATDPDGPALNFEVVSYPARGTLTGTPPNLTYTAGPITSRFDLLTFRANDGTSTGTVATVSISISPSSLPPVADSGGVTTPEDTALALTLTGSDPGGKPLKYYLVGKPKHGVLTGWAPALTYTPVPNFHGTDTVTFFVSNGSQGSANATVTITVSEVNDPPVVQPKSVTTPEDAPVAIAFTATDIDGPAATFDIASPPLRGTLSGSGASRTYTPNRNFFGRDSFTYTASDGANTSAPATVDITVTPLVDPRETIDGGALVRRTLDGAPDGGYKVTGVFGWSDFQLDDLRLMPPNPGPERWQANGGGANVYGPGFTIESAYMQGGKLLMNGKLSLLPTYITDAFGDAVSTDASFYLDDGGNPSLAGATFCFPKQIAIPRQSPKLTIEEVCLTINPATRTYGGSAKIGFDLGRAGNLCFGSAPLPKIIGAEVLIREGRFDTLGVSVENLRQPLGQTGAFLDGLSGKVANISKGSDWYIQATIEVNAGCPITLGGSTIYPVKIRAAGKVAGTGHVEIKGGAYVFNIQVAGSSLKYSPIYNVEFASWVNFNGIMEANAKFSLSSGPTFSGEVNGKIGIPNYVPIVGGWTFASARASANNSGFRGNFSLNITPEIPSVCSPRVCFSEVCPGRPCFCCWCDWCFTPPCLPSICTPRIPAVSAKVGFKFEGGSFSFSTGADDKVEAWELSYRHAVVDQATGNRMSFLSNWSRRDKVSTARHGRPFSKRAGSPVTTFTVPEGEEVHIFRLTYENAAVTSVAMTLDTPTVAGLDVNAGPAPFGFTALPGSFAGVDLVRREAFFLISKPKAGNYTVTLGNDRDLGNFSVEQLRQNPAPTVAIQGIEEGGTPGTYVIRYTSLFSEGSPTTRIYLTHAGADRTQKTGPTFLVESAPSVHGDREFILDARNLDLPPGNYRVAVNIDDPASLEVEALSTQEVSIQNAQAPLPVARIATQAGDGSFRVQWDPSPSPNLTAYTILYTAGSEPFGFEYMTNVDAVVSNVTEVTVTGLTNGQPYLVTVTAVNGDGIESAYGPVQRVVPTAGPGLTPPVIVSAPNVGATATQPYVYVLQTFDGDDALLSVPLRRQGPATDPLPHEADANGLYWELTVAPPGMTILPNGIVQWTPGNDQVGDHAVTVRATEQIGVTVGPALFAEQSYIITVVPSWNLSGLGHNHGGFLTRPPTTATEGTLYAYTPLVLIGGEGFALSIVEGPPDMGLSMDAEGHDTVVWNVPAGAPGQHVRLRAAPRNAQVTEADYVYQDFFLNVVGAGTTLPRPDAPVAGPDTLGTDSGRSVTLPISRLLVNDRSPSGMPIDLIAADQAMHGVVTLVGNELVYTPFPGYVGPDAFTYTLSDGVDQVPVTVQVTVRGEQTPNMFLPSIVGDDVILRFGGIAGRTYVVQRATDVAGPWVDLPGPVLIPALMNVGTYTDAGGAAQAGFYRTRAQ